MFKAGWEKIFQKAVKNLGLNGFTVASMRGKVQLKLRSKDSSDQSVCLPVEWEEKNWGDAYARIRNIYKFIAKGHNLKAAAELAQGKAPKKGKDWVHILGGFNFYGHEVWD